MEGMIEMSKKVLAAILVAAMTIMMAMPVMAASGLNSNEESLHATFAEKVRSQSWLGKSLTNQYITEAENALTKVDLDAAACAELNSAIDAVMKILSDNNVTSLHEAKQYRQQYLDAVNPVAGKYNMRVELDAKSGIATVYVNGEAVTPRRVVNQTGFDFTSTIAVIAALAAAALAAVIIRRKHVFA